MYNVYNQPRLCAGSPDIWGRVPGAGGAGLQVLGRQLGLQPHLPLLRLLSGEQRPPNLGRLTL